MIDKDAQLEVLTSGQVVHSKRCLAVAQSNGATVGSEDDGQALPAAGKEHEAKELALDFLTSRRMQISTACSSQRCQRRERGRFGRRHDVSVSLYGVVDRDIARFDWVASQRF